MSRRTRNSKDQLSPRPLLPKRLSFLFDERPVLWFENGEDYDALLAEICATYDPQGVIEFILVKDIVDTLWECVRLRHMRRSAIDVEFPHAAYNLMGRFHEEEMGMGTVEARESLLTLVRDTVHGDEGGRDELDYQSEKAGVTYRMMHYEAYKLGLHTIGAIEDALTRTERRHDQLVRMIEDRRRTLRSMSQSLLPAARDKLAANAPDYADEVKSI